jgi:ATP-binding cassette, subfamily C (CFTR/MRP), member 1
LRLSWAFQALLSGKDYARKFASLEEKWRKFDGRKVPSLAFALNDTLGSFFWTAGIFKVCLVLTSSRYPYMSFSQIFGDISQLMCPLVIKVRSSGFVANRNYADLYGKSIINFAKARQEAKANHEPEPSLGIGVAMAIGLFLLTVLPSIGQNQVRGQ